MNEPLTGPTTQGIPMASKTELMTRTVQKSIYFFIFLLDFHKQ